MSQTDSRKGTPDASSRPAPWWGVPTARLPFAVSRRCCHCGENIDGPAAREAAAARVDCLRPRRRRGSSAAGQTGPPCRVRRTRSIAGACHAKTNIAAPPPALGMARGSAAVGPPSTRTASGSPDSVGQCDLPPTRAGPGAQPSLIRPHRPSAAAQHSLAPAARRPAPSCAPQHLGGHVAVGSSPARRVAQVVRQPGRPLVRAGPCISRCGRAARVGSTRALSGHALVRGRGHGDARSRASGERVRSSVSSCACARPQVCNHVRAR